MKENLYVQYIRSSQVYQSTACVFVLKKNSSYVQIATKKTRECKRSIVIKPSRAVRCGKPWYHARYDDPQALGHRTGQLHSHFPEREGNLVIELSSISQLCTDLLINLLINLLIYSFPYFFITSFIFEVFDASAPNKEWTEIRSGMMKEVNL